MPGPGTTGALPGTPESQDGVRFASHPTHTHTQCALTSYPPVWAWAAPVHRGELQPPASVKRTLLVCIYPEGSLWHPQPLGGGSLALAQNLGPLQVSGGLGVPVISGCLVGSPSFPAPKDSGEVPSLEQRRAKGVNFWSGAVMMSKHPCLHSLQFSMPNSEYQHCCCAGKEAALASGPQSYPQWS